MEVGQPDADRDELGDERDQVGEGEIAGAEPAPHAAVALQHQLAIAAVGDGADAHAHLLADERHREQHRDERHEEPEPVLRAVGGVGDHARPVVLPEHREDPGADEQPQQIPAPAVPARVMDARAIQRPSGVLLGQRRQGEACGTRRLQSVRHRPAPSGYGIGASVGRLLDFDAHRAGELAADRVLALSEDARTAGRRTAGARARRTGLPARSRGRRGSAASPGRSPRRARTPPAHRRCRLSMLCVERSSSSRSALGIGSPWGSTVGCPSLAAISSSRSSESTCSSTSASA